MKLAHVRGVTGSVFGLEGQIRAQIRSEFCLRGWRWRTADHAAKDLLAEAFRQIRAERPKWNEGQPEFVALPGLQIERTRCAQCHKPLPTGRPKFCSKLCSDAHHNEMARRKAHYEKEARECATILI